MLSNSRNKNTWSYLSIMAMGAFGIACGDTDAQVNGGNSPASVQVASPADGLVIDRDGAALRGTYRKAGRTIYFEAAVGPETPHEVRAGDTDAPTEEIDVRFLDAAKAPFLSDAGGHGFVDPSWQVAIDEQDYAAASAFRDLDFGLAQEAANALRDAWVPQEWVSQRDKLSMLGASTADVPMVAEEQIETAEALGVPSSTETSVTGFGTTAQGLSAPWADTVEIRRKRAFFAANVLGDHSAIRWTRRDRGGRLLGVWSTSNHGTSASSSTMSTRCSRTIWRSWARGTWSEPCPTPYGFQSGRHVCNDDTAVQYADFRLNAASSLATCRDSSLRRYAPTCN